MDLESSLTKIRAMEVRGAGRIARFAASIVKDTVSSSSADSVEILTSEVMDLFRKLNATRPTAVSLKNGLRLIHRNSILKFKEGPTNVDEAKSEILAAADDFINHSESATLKIGEFGAGKIKNGFTIQTHCNSSAALSVIKTAYDQGKSIKVYATESRPWYQGHITVKELAEYNIPVTLIVDSAVRHFMDDIDIVLVGGDTITAEGNLYNKIGTSQVALAANDANVPFLCCAETYKFSPDSLYLPDSEIIIEERDIKEVVQDPAAFPGVNISNPVFDITPAKHITEIVTEEGLITPDKSKVLIKHIFGEKENLLFFND